MHHSRQKDNTFSWMTLINCVCNDIYNTIDNESRTMKMTMKIVYFGT